MKINELRNWTHWHMEMSRWWLITSWMSMWLLQLAWFRL